MNRCARLRAAAAGGQVLLSAATQELVRDHLPAGVSLRDLGECRLRDLARPERVYQLCAPDLPADFPPLRGLDARPHNLPVQRTPLIGREPEHAAVRQLLLRSDEIACAALHVFTEREPAVERGALVVKGDARASGEGKLAAVQLGLAGEHP